MHFDPNNLFYRMAKTYSDFKTRGDRLVICNEGGSRSSKTWDTNHLIIAICAKNINANLDIYILRDTLINCKDHTYKDFVKVINLCGIKNDAKFTNPQRPTCNLYGNNIYFRGLDDETNTEGYPSDIIFVNEVLETKKTKVEGLFMRCESLIIMDWNPKLTKHWVFEYEGRPDVLFTHSTYKDNKHLAPTIVKEIESYNPAIEENVKNKTANLFRWKVYGQGVRSDQEGNVFNDSQLNKFDIDKIDLTNSVKIGWCDVADQGIDYLCFVIGAIVGQNVYVIDVVYTQKDSDHSIPLVMDAIVKHNVSAAWFESNNQGLGYTKQVKQEFNMQGCAENGIVERFEMLKYRSPYNKRIKAMPNTKNKHSRIIVQAEINVIKNFYFLNYRTGMYEEYYDNLTNYKHDKSVKQDDAPDATAGLSAIIDRYM